MTGKIRVRADGTYMLEGCRTDNPKLGAKVLADGRDSLFLDYYFGYELVEDEATGRRIARKRRRRESLKLYLWKAPGTPEKRRQNRETLDLARRIRFEKEQVMKEERLGYRLGRRKEDDFIEYFKRYCEDYRMKDKKVIVMAFNRFRDFVTDSPKYHTLSRRIRPDQLTKEMMCDFTWYLKGRSRGCGAWSVYQRFKKVINHAVEEGLLRKSPCAGVSIKVDENILSKDILSVEDMQALFATEVRALNPEVRRAFIFCLYTGLRFCDVKWLTFSNIDFSNKLLRFEQIKTRGRSASSGVIIPLNEGILRLVGRKDRQLNEIDGAGTEVHASKGTEDQIHDVMNEDREDLRARKRADGMKIGRRQLIIMADESIGKGLGPDDKIFDLPSYECCLKSLKRWVKAAGISKHISWHCARHSFAVNILNNGANIRTLASLLGHSSLKHTEKYTRAVDRLKVEAINSLPEVWW